MRDAHPASCPFDVLAIVTVSGSRLWFVLIPIPPFSLAPDDQIFTYAASDPQYGNYMPFNHIAVASGLAPVA